MAQVSRLGPELCYWIYANSPIPVSGLFCLQALVCSSVYNTRNHPTLRNEIIMTLLVSPSGFVRSGDLVQAREREAWLSHHLSGRILFRTLSDLLPCSHHEKKSPVATSLTQFLLCLSIFFFCRMKISFQISFMLVVV